MRNHYRSLEIDNDADDETIEKAYQRLRRRFENNPSNEAKARLRNITEAYAVLSDPRDRADYDRKLAGITRDAVDAEPLNRGQILAVGVVVAAIVAVIVGVVVAVVLANGGDSNDAVSPTPAATLPPTTPGPETPPPVEGEPTVTESGLQIYDLLVGNGVPATAGSTLIVHYTGWLEDGSKFDSSLDRSQPFTVVLGQTPPQVIDGWEEGLLGILPGGIRRLVIPPELAYGQAGSGSLIPPNATLTFDIEVIQIVLPEPTPTVSATTPTPAP